MENTRYIEAMFDAWQADVDSVDAAWNEFFSRETAARGHSPATTPAPKPAEGKAYKQSRVDSLLWAYRDVGYLHAKLNPLGGDYAPGHSTLDSGDGGTVERLTLEDFGLGADDLETEFWAGKAMHPSTGNLRQILDAFQKTYCGSIGVEFLHIQNKKVRRWLIERMEASHNRPNLSTEQKRIVLADLIRTEELEKFLGTHFIGQKRFSLEGSEALIPGLHFLADSAPRHGIEEIVIGTTHRGRLSILHTILNMSAEEIFSSFEENYGPGMYGGGGDVKYHIGFDTEHVHEDGSRVHVSVVANPSHLESVDSVVEGKTRGLQDRGGGDTRRHILPVLLHGDAAFAGQGVVAETLNLAQLAGYTTGGTVHVIVNNQIGFTTPARSARSTYFPTDIAKGMRIPIFHVNGDDPEALVHVMNLALEYRQEFGRDVVVDIFCFRRHGHNEGDEPSFTHPRMYSIIKEHPGVAHLYQDRCTEEGVMSADDAEALRAERREFLKQALERQRSEPVSHVGHSQGEEWEALQGEDTDAEAETAVDESVLKQIIDRIGTFPDDFHIHRKLKDIVERRTESVGKDGMLDWAFAETLAFGSLLLEGIPVRLSGQDCTRGTFSQRHLTWWDTESQKPKPYMPLNALSSEQAELRAFDSPLSEYSVLGFEYGYSLVQPNALVIWEAQFGDFSNGAQVVVDNYVMSAEKKWNRSSGLAMLLPHGYEGQGPDHSSGYPERFLQMCADGNVQVCNPTTPAQYFHLLRRQVKRDFRKPLIVLTPKSLLRHSEAVSPLDALASGTFRSVLDDDEAPETVDRLMLCSGKVYYDLCALRKKVGAAGTAIVRVEQLYPFPAEALSAIVDAYGTPQEIVWVQEEHRNYGAWTFMREMLRRECGVENVKYQGRAESASKASGSYHRHQREQEVFLNRVFREEVAKQKG